jgi:hypothetical protein
MKIGSTALHVAAVAALASLSAPARAASDYLLELEGVAGEAKPAPIEFASWSLGASNPTSVGSSGMSAGRRQHDPVRLTKPFEADGSISLVSPRDAASGLATGKSSCPTGKHFPSAIITARGDRWMLRDVSLACTADGMTLDYKTAAALPPPGESAIVKSKSNITNN